MYYFIMLLCTFLDFQSEAQTNLFYEQIAFDYYSTVIIDSFPASKRIRINEFVVDIHPNIAYQDIAKCSLPNINRADYELIVVGKYEANQLDIGGNQFRLDLTGIDNKKFKVKSNGIGNYPKIKISLPVYHPLDTNTTLVTVYEHLSILKSNIYTLNINEAGEITSWCREERQYIQVH